MLLSLDWSFNLNLDTGLYDRNLKRCNVCEEIKSFQEYSIRRSRRRKALVQAIPAWADLEAMKLIYVKAATLSKETGVSHHVDHIYPLSVTG